MDQQQVQEIVAQGPKAEALAFEHDRYAPRYQRGASQRAWNAVGYGRTPNNSPSRSRRRRQRG